MSAFSVSGPPNALRGRFHREQLSGSGTCNFRDFLHATPLRGNDEQRLPFRASKHASKAAAVGGDRLQNLAPFAHTNTTPIGNVGVPYGAMCIDADAVRDATNEVGPDA